MRYRPVLPVLVAGLALALAGAQAAAAHNGDGGRRDHAVFVQTNDPAGNSIAVFDRDAGGRLHRVATYATGGNGGVASPGTESDHLASQGSLRLASHHHVLIAVNAGSDTVSSFRVNGDQLRLVSVVPSGGQFPASVAVHKQLVYILNSGGSGIVKGFRLDGASLVPIPGSERSLGLANGNPPDFLMSPGQVGFTPGGDQLLVTTKASTSAVDVFQVGHDGLLSAAPVVNPSATPVPFAFTFSPGGLLADGEAGASSLTTYTVAPTGVLTGPKSQADGQTALCWILRVRDVYFVSNTGSNDLSSFRLGPDGQPELLSPIAAVTNPGPVDLTASDGFLYAETGINGTVDEFGIGPNGTLSPIGSVDDLPPGIEGIAAS